MTKIKWTSLKRVKPDNHRAILIRDHERNYCPGFWENKFVPFFPIPIGFLKHWTYIKVIIIPHGDYDLIDADNFILENGVTLRLTELYDFDDPVKINLS